MEEIKKKAVKMVLLEHWENRGVACHYVRFQAPVPPSKDKEPVSEFCTQGPTTKYIVDRITYCEQGVIWRANGELDITPLANVMYSRSTT
jgi:hypothetical protein